MKLIVGVLAAAAALQAGPASEFNEIAPHVINIAYNQGVSSARPGTGRGPVLIDLESFRAAARALDGKDVDSEVLLRAAGAKARTVDPGEGVVCVPNPQFPKSRNCSVRDDGVLIQVDQLTRTASGVDVLVTVKTTERRPVGGATATAPTTLRISFGQERGAWSVVKRKTVASY